MCDNDTNDNDNDNDIETEHYAMNKDTLAYINDLNHKLLYLNFENGHELQVLLDYRKNLIYIEYEEYQSNNPNDLILCLYKRFKPITYMHIKLHDDFISLEYVKTTYKYQNQGQCKFLLSILIVLSRLINPNINIIYLDSINNKLSYLTIFIFDAIPQIIYYKSCIDIKDEFKITQFKNEVLEMKDKSITDKYKYIKSFDKRFSNDLFLNIDINELFVLKIQAFIDTLL